MRFIINSRRIFWAEHETRKKEKKTKAAPLKKEKNLAVARAREKDEDVKKAKLICMKLH